MRNVNRAPRREPERPDPLSHAPPTAHQQHAKGMAPKHPSRHRRRGRVGALRGRHTATKAVPVSPLIDTYLVPATAPRGA
eukprot:4357266-Prymnesium_polylepis.1